MHNAPGPSALRAWIAEDPKHRKFAAIGKALVPPGAKPVTGQAVAQWANGDATPTPENQRLLRALGVKWPPEEMTPPGLAEALGAAREAGARFRKLAREGRRAEA